MMKIGWISRLPQVAHSTCQGSIQIAGVVGVTFLLAAAPIAAAQDTASPEGYGIHQSADLGGHLVGLSGSGAMYDTLVNIHSGPRVLGQTFSMHAEPGTKHGLVDDLTSFSNGFGGDPNNFARLDFSKGKLYEFGGLFRRDRQYFDYDLLGNPNIPAGIGVPYGKANGVPSASILAWPQQNVSSVMFNSVRRMTDTNLTLLPLSKVTFRLGYSDNIFQGPSLSPGGSSPFFAPSIGAGNTVLQQFQRNSTDDFLGAIDWKPFSGTKLTFEEQVSHYKGDAFFTLNPRGFQAQEADGTPVYLSNSDALAAPYGIRSCDTASMGSAYTNPTTYTIFTAPSVAGGLPIINPACNVVTSYHRSQPTRTLTPTEIVRVQSSSLKNIALNGNLRFTKANSNLANYYESFQGLSGTTRSALYTGNASVQRRVVAADFGLTWEATRTLSLSEQIDFSNVHQPGISNISAGSTLVAPAGNVSVTYVGPLAPGRDQNVEGNSNGTPQTGYFGQKWITNNATATWDLASRATLSFTYRYRTHTILQDAASGDNATVTTVHQNGGILNASIRPTRNLDLNGSVEISYADNAYVAVAPRQLKHYRFHVHYRARPWATVSGAFNDLERHNNTFSTQDDLAAGNATYVGPLQHSDYSRTVSLGTTLAPNEHYGFDFNYAYSDVYTTTNICYLNGATPTLPGAAQTNSSGGANICPGIFARGSTTVLSDWGPTADFIDAPTQYMSAALTLSPNKKVHTNVGYRISAVSGSQFFNDARAVNGSLQSAYQSPYVSVAWTVHPGWIWKAEYNYYGYGEGGESGAQSCSTSTTVTSAVVPCSNFPGLTGITVPPAGFTAPRDFHANNVTLGMHYEF